MSIQKYRAFLATIENQSLTRTAEQLGYTQPGISHMLSSLEHEIGFPLLVRTNDGIFPTEDARQLQYYMRQIVTAEDTLQEIVHKIQGVESGSLRIGTFSSTSARWLPTIISTFLSRHGNIKLQILEGTHSEVCQWLTEGMVDLAFVSAPVPEKFAFIPLWDDPILAALSRDHPLAGQETIDPQELIRYPFIVPYEGADETVWQVMDAERLTPNVKFRIKGDSITMAMIGQNLGVSLIPELTLAELSEQIVTRPLTGHYFRTLGVCMRSERHASPAAKEFLTITKHFITDTWRRE